MKMPVRRALLLFLSAVSLLSVPCCSRPSHEKAGDRQILIVPIGRVPPDLTNHLARELPVIFHRRVTVAAEVPLPLAAFDSSRQQYRGTALLDELEHRFEGHDAERVIGIIDADAYAPGLNFIFGQSQKPGRVAVIALAHLRQSFRKRPDEPQLLRDRVTKIMTHELGHSFGLPHCSRRRCVMHFASSVFEVDDQGLAFCRRERKALE